ncbi:hypothetical protein ABPG72_011056 [Tetrahymena utriculariae]
MNQLGALSRQVCILANQIEMIISHHIKLLAIMRKIQNNFVCQEIRFCVSEYEVHQISLLLDNSKFSLAFINFDIVNLIILAKQKHGTIKTDSIRLSATANHLALGQIQLIRNRVYLINLNQFKQILLFDKQEVLA